MVVFAFFSTVFAELLETTFFALDCETVFVRFFKADALGTLVFTLEIFLGSAFLGDLVTFLAEITFLSLESFFVIFFDEFALEFLGDGAFVEFLSETILDLVIAFVAFLEEAIFTDFDAPFVPFLTGLVAFLAELAFVDFGAFLLELPLLPFSVLVTFLLAVIFFGETCWELIVLFVLVTPFDEANFVLLFAVVLFDFDAIFDESFIVDLEALLVLFFWETILDVFEADFIEFLAKTGLDVFEAVLVLFLDDDDIGFLAIAFVVAAFVSFFVDDLFVDFSITFVEFLVVAIFLAPSFLELDDLITFLVPWEDLSLDLLSLDAVLFALEEVIVLAFGFFETSLLLYLVCLESTFVVFLVVDFDDLIDYFLVFLFLVSTFFVDFIPIESILVLFFT